MEFQGQKVLSLQDSLRCSTRENIRRCHHMNYTLWANSFGCTYKNQKFVLIHEWGVLSETPLIILRLLCAFSTRRSTSKSGVVKDCLLRLRSSTMSTFKCLINDTLHWCGIMSARFRKPKVQDGHEKRDAERSTTTNAHHTHCAPRQLWTKTHHRYNLPQDWLWVACQPARVCWGTHCEGFCSMEGPHYGIEQSSRNPLKCDQVQRALVKLFRSCCQTSNNQP